MKCVHYEVRNFGLREFGTDTVISECSISFYQFSFRKLIKLTLELTTIYRLSTQHFVFIEQTDKSLDAAAS